MIESGYFCEPCPVSEDVCVNNTRIVQCLPSDLGVLVVACRHAIRSLALDPLLCVHLSSTAWGQHVPTPRVIGRRSTLCFHSHLKHSLKQESIPVGCIPSAAVAVGEGGCLPRRGVCLGGVCRGRCLPRGCLPRGCVCLEKVSAQGVSAWGCLPGGCLPGGVSQIPPCEENDWQTGVKTLPCPNYVANVRNDEISLCRDIPKPQW